MPRLTLPQLLAVLLACPSSNDDTSGSDGDTTTSSGATTIGTTANGPTTSEPGTSTGQTTGAPLDDCTYLAGKTFRSDDEFACFDPNMGNYLCHYQILFTSFEFTLQRDNKESGPYTCQDGMIVADLYDGTIEADTGKLVFDDVPYTVMP